ncbi:site-specific integrase [Sanyastnella coralliicola]|uniref:site-specific integrase n=1 Tax=Sanyastnella coralliicola TaxID=3069118 RepID=UPI0027BAB79D|nr:site-specific integrase [Longitalea sp. SCSIO 12813]
MKVTVREKDMGNGTSTLFLDIYHKGKRKKESLKLKVFNQPKDAQERKHNKEIRLLADDICAERHLLEAKKRAGVLQEFQVETEFLPYFRKLADERFESKGNFGNWDSVYKILEDYIEEPIRFKDIDREWVMRFRKYLDKEHRGRGYKLLSQATKHSYFNKLKACFNQAINEKIIAHSPAQGVKSFSIDKGAERVFLTKEELERAFYAECDSEILKRAFLFSCFTGLRHSDLMKLQWRHIDMSKPDQPVVRVQQRKTKDTVSIPLNETAFRLAGEPLDPDARVFRGLKYSSEMNIKLSRWMLRAGIDKKITFHCARHTFATVLLNEDTNLATIQKLLGHRDLKTTAIYAKVMDRTKQEAIDKLPNL